MSTQLGVAEETEVAMNHRSLALWERRPEARISLVKALDLFEADYRASNYSPRTVAWYRQRLEEVFDHLRASHSREPVLVDLTVPNFRLFILEKQAMPAYMGHPFKAVSQKGPSSAYLHAFFRAVRGFSSWLFKERLIPTNVMAELEMPRLAERELQPLTEVEELRLLEAYSETSPRECRNKAIFLLMLSTGIRKGELISLKYEAVNLEEGFISVWGKGKRQRSVPFGYKTAWVLQRYRLTYRVMPAGPHCDTFFLTQDGLPMTERVLDAIFERARTKTGIKRLHPHLLRHTYGTRSAEMNIPTLTLQRFMDHSVPTVTERYSHVAASEKLKRDRTFDHVDLLNLRVRRPKIGS
jgi:site-specific recombinase XerD